MRPALRDVALGKASQIEEVDAGRLVQRRQLLAELFVRERVLGSRLRELGPGNERRSGRWHQGQQSEPQAAHAQTLCAEMDELVRSGNLEGLRQILGELFSSVGCLLRDAVDDHGEHELLERVARFGGGRRDSLVIGVVVVHQLARDDRIARAWTRLVGRGRDQGLERGVPGGTIACVSERFACSVLAPSRIRTVAARLPVSCGESTAARRASTA